MSGRIPNAMMIDPRFTPRSSARAGLSRRIVLLALAGLGAGLFLFVVLPWLTTSRAAEARTRPLRDSASSQATQVDAGTDNAGANGVELVTVLDAPGVVEEAPAVAEAQTTVVESVAGGVPGTSALVAAQVTDTGPKLKRLKGGGNAGKTTSAQMHAAQREKRQAERARGIDPKATQAAKQATARAEAKANPNPNRDKIKTSAKAPPGPGKGKRRKKQAPTGG